MTKLRIVYIASLVILGVLLVFIFRPMTSGEKFSQVQRVQLLETEDGWIVELDIINREGKDTDYTINVSIDGKLYTERVSIVDGGEFTYIHHIFRDKLNGGDVSFTIYKQGEPHPIEQVTYHLK